MVKPAKKAPVIKKGNNVENDESFATVTFTPCTEQYHSKLKAGKTVAIQISSTSKKFCSNGQ